MHNLNRPIAEYRIQLDHPLSRIVIILTHLRCVCDQYGGSYSLDDIH